MINGVKALKNMSLLVRIYANSLYPFYANEVQSSNLAIRSSVIFSLMLSRFSRAATTEAHNYMTDVDFSVPISQRCYQ